MFWPTCKLISITADPPHRIELSAGNVSRQSPAAVFSGLRNIESAEFVSSWKNAVYLLNVYVNPRYLNPSFISN